jgi:hypothetical protein
LNIGTSGVNKDGVDGKWGNLTQTAFNQAKAIKAKSAATTPATTSTTPATTTPTTTPATTTAVAAPK